MKRFIIFCAPVVLSLTLSALSIADPQKRTMKNQKGEIVKIEIEPSGQTPCTNLGKATTLSESLAHLNDARNAAAQAEKIHKLEAKIQWWTNFGGRTTSQFEYERSLAAAQVKYLAKGRFSVDLLSYVKPQIAPVRLAWHRLERALELRSALENLKAQLVNNRSQVRGKMREEINRLKAVYLTSETAPRGWKAASDLDLVEMTLERVAKEIFADEHTMLDRFTVYKGIERMLNSLAQYGDEISKENATRVIEALKSENLLKDFFADSRIQDQKTPTIEEIQAYLDSSQELKLWYLNHKKKVEMWSAIGGRLPIRTFIETTEKFFTRFLFNPVEPQGEISKWQFDVQKWRAMVLSANNGRFRRTYLPTLMSIMDQQGKAIDKAYRLANANAGTNNELLITFARVQALQPLWYEIYGEAEKSVIANRMVDPNSDGPIEPEPEPTNDSDKSKNTTPEPESIDVSNAKMTDKQIQESRGLGTLYRDMRAAREVADHMDNLRLEGGAFDAGVSFNRFIDFAASSGLATWGLKYIYQYFFAFSPMKPTRKIAGQPLLLMNGAPLNAWEEWEVDIISNEIEAVFQKVPPEEMIKLVQ